jgi:uncharacterized coiled-coil DUF342 family protein
MKKGLLIAVICLSVLLVAGGIFSYMNITDRQNSIDTLTAESAEKSAQIDTLTAESAEKSVQIDTLTTESAEKSTQIDTLAAESAEKSIQIDTLTTESAEKSTQIDTLTAESAEKSAQIDTLTAESAEKSTQIDTLTAESAEKSAQIDTLTAESAEKSAQIDTLTAESAEKSAQIDTLTAESAEKSAQIDTLTAESAEKSAQIDALIAESAEKDAQIDALNASNTEKDGSIAALEKALDEANAANGTSIEPKVIEPFVPVYSGDGWDITADFSFAEYRNYNYAIVIRNTTSEDKNITVSFKFFDSKNQLIGISEGEVYCAAPGHDYYIQVSNDTEFDHVETTVALKKAEFIRSMDDALIVKCSYVGQKALISVDNTGGKEASLVEYHVVFYDESNNYVDSAWGFFDTIPANGTYMCEEKCSKAFDHAGVYYNAIDYGW